MRADGVATRRTQEQRIRNEHHVIRHTATEVRSDRTRMLLYLLKVEYALSIQQAIEGAPNSLHHDIGGHPGRIAHQHTVTGLDCEVVAVVPAIGIVVASQSHEQDMPC